MFMTVYPRLPLGINMLSLLKISNLALLLLYIELHLHSKPSILSWEIAAAILLRSLCLRRPYPNMARRCLQSRRLNRRPEPVVEQHLGPS
jgi:hypothetical protein